MKNNLVLTLVLMAIFSPVKAQDLSAARDYLNRGRECYRKEDFDCAITNFTKAIAAGRGKIDLSRRTQAWSVNSDLKSELTDSEITFVDPVTAAAYGFRALARYRKGDVAAALADCDRAISIHPGVPELYSNRGVIRWGNGDLAGAIADFDRVIRISPRDAQAYENRGNAHLDKGELAAALLDINHAIALNPRNAEFYCSRGQVLQDTGDVDGGLADCDHAILLDPNLARAFYCRGTAWYLKNDLDRSIAAFRTAISINPRMAVAHGNLGWVLWHAGRQEEAEKEFAECLRLDPSLRTELERKRAATLGIVRPRR